jgi:hypothetical protein
MARYAEKSSKYSNFRPKVTVIALKMSMNFYDKITC